ncbi:MAG: M48 family metallopeptidase [Beijerinckiaceae bacterium]
MTAFGLYTHIRSNRRRSAFLLTALFMLVYALTFAGALSASAFTAQDDFAGHVTRALRDTASSAPFVTIGVIVWIGIAWRFNQAIISLALPSHGLTRTEAPKLYNMLENLCISRGMPMPKLAIVEVDAPNAFASGVNEKQFTITLTRGLLNTLDDAEIEAVMAHELTHIRNGDVRMMVVAMIIAGVVSFFCELFFRMFARGGIRFGGRSGGSSSSSGGSGDKKGGAAAAIAVALLIIAAAWALSLMIRLMLSRTREYLADAGSVELTKNPDAMISALRKVGGKGEIEGATSGVMEMCLDNPRAGFADLFSSHPSIEDRIEALKKFAGGMEELPKPPA